MPAAQPRSFSHAAPALAVFAAAVIAGCSTAPAPTDDRASLNLQLQDADAQHAAGAPASFERHWTGNPLGPGDLSSDLHEIYVNFTTPMDGDTDVSPRNAVLVFPEDQVVVTQGAGTTQIITLQRPAVTLTLARGEGNDAGVARITFAPSFQETLFHLDPDAQTDEALWLAVLGTSVDDTRLFTDANLELSIQETIQLAEIGVNPSDILALENQGTALHFDELIALHQAGELTTTAVADQSQTPSDTDAQAEFENTPGTTPGTIDTPGTTPSPAFLTHVDAPFGEMVELAPDEPLFTLDAQEQTDEPLFTLDAENQPVELVEVETDLQPTDAVEETIQTFPTHPAPNAPAAPQAYAALLKPLGFTDVQEVVTLFDAGVTADEVQWFQNAGLSPTVDNMIDAHLLGLDPVDARILIDAGYDVTFADLKTLHAAGTDPAYAAALFDGRFRPLTAKQIANLWQNRVSINDVRTARERRLDALQASRD